MCVNECERALRHFFRKSAWFSRLFPLSLTALLLAPAGVRGQTTNPHPLCTAIANGKIQASSGAQMWCFGSQPNGPSAAVLKAPVRNLLPSPFGPSSRDRFTTTNVNTANLSEDLSGSGVRADGQSEVSIAAAGSDVVEAWNDSTGFLSSCPSPMNKEEFTGLAFSSDGGKTFTDLGGVPNSNCANFISFGDPSVEAYQVGGKTYFYIASLYPTTFSNPTPVNNLAITACQVLPGSAATLSCSQPIIAATSSECLTEFGFTFCSFLDKDFLSIDVAHAKLYLSYTDFGFITHPNDIDLAVCDLSNPAAPVCQNGSQPVGSPPAGVAPYLTVAPTDFVNFCEREGAYPAVDPATGDVYVAHEFNWATNLFGALFGGPCGKIATLLEVAHVPTACLTLPTASCAGPDVTNSVSIASIDGTFVAGYNRFPPNDFPRIAVSDASGTVSIVWNDVGANPLGDILLQSYTLASLSPIQSAPVKLNNDSGTGTLHFMPAVRNVDAHGNLNVTWYDRRLNPSSALTDVFAALEVNPRTTSTPRSNTRVTNVSADWLSNSSLIVPNFGDYTDNYVETTSGSGLTARIFAAWSDGRLNIPQPFCAHQGLK